MKGEQKAVMINFSMNPLKVIMNIAVPLLNVSYNAAKKEIENEREKKMLANC